MKILMARLEWKPQDCWIGVFWKTSHCETDDGKKPFVTDVWVCLLPMVPIHLQLAHSVQIDL